MSIDGLTIQFLKWFANSSLGKRGEINIWNQTYHLKGCGIPAGLVKFRLDAHKHVAVRWFTLRTWKFLFTLYNELRKYFICVICVCTQHICSVRHKSFQWHFLFRAILNGQSCVHKLFPVFVNFVSLHCALSLVAQCIVIGPVCGGRRVFVCLWVCYHDNSKLRASIFTKLGLQVKVVIKFWPTCAPGKGVCGGAKIFGSAFNCYSQRAVFASLRELYFKEFPITVAPPSNIYRWCTVCWKLRFFCKKLKTASKSTFKCWRYF